MTEIRVWGPRADTIKLAAKNRLLAMEEKDNGWWVLNTPLVGDGLDYAFWVDEKGPFPDPRSPWQPAGVHGPSRWVDHALFEWTDGAWQQPPLGSAVIYELHVGTFTPEGTFDSIIDRLDYLADLGVAHMELMPVAQFPGSRGWGYDGVDLYAPHQDYGGPSGLKRLVNACHRKGMAMLLDVVYNHLGPCGNYLHFFGPYFTSRYKTPWGEAVNLDGPDSDEVRWFFIDNARMWLRDYHLDGLRIDAVHAIVDTSAIHFLEELSAEVRFLEACLGRHLVLIAESDLNDPRVVRSPDLGGYGIHAQWNEDFHHALHAVLTGEQNGYYHDFGQLSHLASVLTQGFVYGGRYSVYRRRRHGRPAADLSGHRFVGCLQNHDQVGNRALGERIGHLLTTGQLKLGAALVMTSPFVPLLFQGEEWNASTPFLYFTDHQDPELGEAVRQGRRKEFAAFGWDPHKIPDPQDEETFLKSGLDWDESSRHPHIELLQWYRSLIELRRRFPSLTDGRVKQVLVRFDDSARTLIMVRVPIVVVCNFAENCQRILYDGMEKREVLLSSDNRIKVENSSILMPGQSVIILKNE